MNNLCRDILDGFCDFGNNTSGNKRQALGNRGMY